MNHLGPRVVVGGTHSGVGKTTVATGLMAAFRARGRRVGSAKVGPDYIDPGYHALATGRPARNLDAWMSGPDNLPSLAGRASAGADLMIVEGVMGLFDGASDGTLSSTADVARLLDAPVVLVVDASAMSASVAAVVHGYASLDPQVTVAGVILNRVGSPGHEVMLREAIEPLAIPVLGALHRDDALTWRDRHLGLVPVVERPREVGLALERLAAVMERSVDLAAVEAIASGASPVAVDDPPLPARVDGPRVRIAIAGGPAFSFGYPDNLEALDAAGAELVPFDPCADERLPDACAGLVAGGGFPEVYGEALAANRPLLDEVRSVIAAGIAVWAECGGLLWLARQLDGHPMAGVVAADAVMTDRLTLGYRSGSTRAPSSLGPAGLPLRGHEFHYSTVEPGGDALDLEGRFGAGRAGFATPRLLASYLHLHLGATPELATAFVRTAATAAA